jgi:hypothetical protein
VICHRAPLKDDIRKQQECQQIQIYINTSFTFATKYFNGVIEDSVTERVNIIRGGPYSACTATSVALAHNVETSCSDAEVLIMHAEHKDRFVTFFFKNTSRNC